MLLIQAIGELEEKIEKAGLAIKINCDFIIQKFLISFLKKERVLRKGVYPNRHHNNRFKQIPININFKATILYFRKTFCNRQAQT